MSFGESAIVCSLVGGALLCGCGLLGNKDGTGESADNSKSAPASEPGRALQESAKKVAGIPGLGGIAKAVAGLEKAQEDQGKTYGPVMHWKELAAFLPEKLDGYEADGDLDAKTSNVGAFEVSSAKRRYRSAGKEAVQIELLDTTVAPVLRAPFAVAQMINEDSTKGFKKGTQVDGHEAMVEWESRRKRSHVSVLVGGRFILSVTVNGKDEPDGAERIAKSLDIAKLKGKVGSLEPVKAD